MNQELMVRLFRSIEAEPGKDIVLVAEKIIADEIKKGHTKLAGRLQTILSRSMQSKAAIKGDFKSLLPSGVTIPKDRRNDVPLARRIDRDQLRYETVLPDEIESKISRIEREYVARERLARFGLRPRQKILLHGAPGCGKSMTAERIAWNVGLPFLKVKFEAIISSYLGESAANLQRVFDSIKSSPSVLLLDEFDFLAKARSNGQDSGEMHRLVNILLVLLEEYNGPGLLIATTNFEGIIDGALFRRFDEIIELPKPSVKEIVALLKQTLSGMTTAQVNWDEVANRLLGFSAAIVVKVANDAAKSSVMDGNSIVSQYFIESAIKENQVFNKS